VAVFESGTQISAVWQPLGEKEMKTKTQTDLALDRRIRAAGVSIYIPEDDEQTTTDPSNGLLIYQFGGLSDSRAFDFYGVLDILSTLLLPSISPTSRLLASVLSYRGK